VASWIIDDTGFPKQGPVNRPEVSGGSNVWETGAMGKTTNRKPYPRELRERAVRMVREHEGEYASRWAALTSIAEKFGCNPGTLRTWLRQAERDDGTAAGMTTSEQERLKELERENKELRRANEILRKASAYFAQADLDRRNKT
jgi:transposase-like protein